jgi:hypothetical protein
MNINRNLIFEFDNVANDNNLDTPTINTGNNINKKEGNKIKSEVTLPTKKKKKKCKLCKSKKCFAYKTCEYCSKIYCVMCCGPIKHNCKNLEQYRNFEKERLRNKLFSADCNFNKVNKI